MKRPEHPREFDGPIAEALALATTENEPIFVPASVYCDDRGWSVMNQMQGVLGPDGQVNYSTTYPNVIKAWHRHQRQVDLWFCVVGQIKVGVYCEDTDRRWGSVIGEKRTGVMIIPPPLWHGMATVGPTSAGLFYYVTRAYDPKSPDEERRAFDSVEGFPWTVQHG